MLELQRFLIKARNASLLTVDACDVFDLDTGEKVGVVREKPSALGRFLRWFISRRRLPTALEALETEDESLVFTLRRPATFWRQRLEVYDAEDNLIGYFKSKLLSWRGGQWIYDRRGEHFAEVRGDWCGGNFVFVAPDGRELGIVTRKHAGPGKELFTAADDYVVALHGDLVDQPLAKMLLLGAALARDMVYSEN